MVAAVRRAKSWWAKHPVLGWGVVAVLAAAFVALNALPSGAAQQTLVVNGGSLGSWTTYGTTNIVTNLTAGEPDDATDGVRSSGAAEVTPLRLTMSDFTIPPGAVIDDVTAYARVDRNGSANTMSWRIGMALNGGAPTYTTATESAIGWRDSSGYTMTTAPGGAAWNATNINQLEIIINDNDGTSAARMLDVTQVWAVVTFTPDTTPPTANTSNPLNNAVLTGTSKTVSGTADDGTGSGVASVEVQVARSDGAYWNGATSNWTGTSSTWNLATGTTNWTYAWTPLDSQNNGPLTYTITARATDNASNVGTDATPVTGVKVDNVAPTIASATPIDSTHVDVVFSEALQSGSIDVADFNPITGTPNLAVTAAVLDGTDPTLVHLTTGSQSAQTYTVTCAAGTVLDAAGNTNALTSMNFTGLSSTSLTVTQGSDAGRPSAKLFSPVGVDRVVDELVMTATGGTMNVTSIVVTGVDTVGALQTDVSAVKLYIDHPTLGTLGQWDAQDTQLGITQTFPGQASGSTVTFNSGAGMPLSITSGSTAKIWIVYTVGAGAVDGHIVGSRVNTGSVTATGGTVTQAADIVSANAAQTVHVDGLPIVSITDPAANNAIFTGSSKTIQGTASDGSGSGLTAVDVSILRSDGKYWDGTWTSVVPVWIPTGGTLANWNYIWALDAGQDHAYTYTIAARATDASGLTAALSRTGIVVDNVLPAVVSATAVSATEYDVVFSEDLRTTSITASGFSAVPSLGTVSSAVRDATDPRLVHITTDTPQAPGTGYTIAVAAGSVLDTYGNGNALGAADFLGFDDVAPTVVSATAVSATEYDVVFSEDLRTTSIDPAGFVTDPAFGTVSSVVRDAADPRRVRVTTDAAQTPGASYIVTVAVGSVLDTYGNGNALGTAGFLGFDDVAPEVISAVAVDATHVDLVFSESLQTAIVEGGFTIAGLDVYSVSRDLVDPKVVHLATAVQNGGEEYTVSVDTGSVRDTYGIDNAAGTAGFTGFDVTPPTVVSAWAVSNTIVEVAFNEALDPTTAAVPGNYSIAPLLDVTAVELMGGGKRVRLTVATQTSGDPYTVTVTGVQDLALNTIAGSNTASFTGYDPAADTVPPSDPTDVVAASAADPAIARLTWTASTDNVGVAGYTIFRSVTVAGEYKQIGTSATEFFDDITGVPGQAYWYRVSAYDPSGNESARVDASGTPVTATWTKVPHAAYTSDTKLCKVCHAPHLAASARDILRDSGETPPELGVCYACHDGSGSLGNVKTGADDSFALASGHALEAVATDADLTNSCASCHNPHRDYANAADRQLPKRIVNGVAVSAADNSWCLACHNATNDWYTKTVPAKVYPNSATPTVDATGFPTLGTFPTATAYVAYTDATLNAHASIPASATVSREVGDCLYCHASHRSTGAYDGLVARFQPSTAATLANDQTQGDYATLCFQCHGTKSGGSFELPLAGATNIQQFVTAGLERSGHRIKTEGGTYPQGAPLPCYECHNPHGSARGNTQMLSDALGQDLKTGTAPADAHLVREFCFTCHTTADTAKGWDSNLATPAYAALPAGAKVAGLNRDGSTADTGVFNVLLLPNVNGHREADAQSCYNCHGASYATGGTNVHNPSGGVSQGGEACYGCHVQYRSPMEDGAGAIIGETRATVYHHVMGGVPGAGYLEGDFAPGPTGTYPPSGFVNIYCVTCHVDHDKFNAAPGANLRKDAITSPAEAANTDFGTTGFQGGVCTTCHTLAMSKVTPDGSGQAPDTTSVTQAIDPGRYSASAHRYQVASEFGAGNTFLADCSKCHSDEQAKEYQTSEFAFGTHWSASNRIVSAFGAAVTNPLAETHCYGCHSRAADGKKQVDGQDQFKTAPMTTPGSEYVWQQFQLASKHPVVAAGGDSVECESCHNPHRVTKTTQKVSDPADTLLLMTYTGDDNQPVFCLRCHGDLDGAGSAALPVQLSNGTKYVPYSVTQNGAATATGANNKATNKARGHWSDTSAIGGAISAGERISCAECHDNHASSVVKLVGVFDPVDGLSKITNPVTLAKSTITANDNTVCAACHTGASAGFPVAVRQTGTGYPESGTFPGMAVYNTAFVAKTSGNGHLNAQGVAGKTALPTTYPAGDCKVCHDVHGTANTYDELRGTLVNNNFSLCFDCHDLDGPAARNIKAYYPGAVGGAGSNNMGHLIRTAGGNLPVGGIVPCYNCHNAHGSSTAAFSLLINTMTGPATTIVIGDAANEIRMSPSQIDGAGEEINVRNFCFSCHTTADGALGWNGSALAAVTAGAKVEGLDRTTTGPGEPVLRLPNRTGHLSTDTTQSCYQCHGNDYSTLVSNNVHNPSGGVSAGGQDCYGCHTGMKAFMEDDTAPQTGASNATVYHHVLGGDPDAGGPATYVDGDNAFASTQYPTDVNAVFCLSCHVDHGASGFTPATKSSNLRGTFTAAPSKTNTDWDDGTNTGICTSCHATSLTKSGAAEKLSDGRTRTPAVSDAAYDASAHKYTASSTFTGSPVTTFNASCSKCHSDEQTKDYQDSTYTFGTHWSANQHIISALGGANADQLQETQCYRCHSQIGDTVGGTKKAVAARDWYDAVPMTTAGTERVFQQFQMTSTHPVVADAGGSVECESCHNAHVVTATTGKVTDPDNTYNTIAYATSANQVTFCLKCHDGAPPTRDATMATYVPYSVAQANATLNNKSTNAARGHWSISGAIGAGEEVSCAECHENHGSVAPKLLGAYDMTDGRNEIDGAAITANDNTVCAACHTAATGTSYTRLAGGYPNIGTWPGTTVYNGANGIHKGSTVVWPGSSYVGGDCKNCHDVHGTANTYDELRGTFAPNNFGSCFECHDGAPSSANIEQFYPTTNGGTATQTSDSNYGHKIQTAVAGGLAVGSGLPCYDCHNPHGSAAADGLLVETSIAGVKYWIGDAAGEINMATAAGNRLFCFTCHTGDTSASDTTIQGTNATGTGFTTITAADRIEGQDRTFLDATNKTGLHLPAIAGHYTTLGTQGSCYTCHGNDYGAGGSNVHNPTGGVSNGGLDCYGCHSTYQTYMEDGTGTKVGANRTATYHHVMGGTPVATYYDGDYAFGTAANKYPVSQTQVFCLSCHVDHDQFNANKAANLRSNFTATSGASNTDFAATGGGVCMGCHTAALAKDTTNQKSFAVPPSTVTPALSIAGYGDSAHNFLASSSFNDGTTFSANCVKCHDDEQSPPAFQTSTLKFGTHWSAERRVLAAMGITVTDPLAEEQECYRCHSVTADNQKTTTNLDWYGSAGMSAKSQAIFGLMTRTYKHNVGGYIGLHPTSPTDETRAYNSANKHVECADCHGVHSATTTPHTASLTNGNLVSGVLTGVPGAQATFSGTNWTSPTAYTQVPQATYEYQICFKCHSAYNTNTQTQTGGTSFTTLITWGGTGAGAWTDQGLEFSPANRSFHPVVAALNSPGSGSQMLGATVGGTTDMRPTPPAGGVAWHNGDTMYCSDCHAESLAGSLGPHGSAIKWILKGPNQAWPYATAAANGTANTTGWRTYSARDTNLDTSNGLFCRNCHVLNGAEHTRSNHNIPCVGCHIRVPHGGKAPRLLNATGSNTGIGNLPPRYTATGTGTHAGYLLESVWRPAAGATWGQSNSCNGSVGCTSHSAAMTYSW